MTGLGDSTEITLREYMDTRFASVEARITASLESLQRAVIKAEAATDLRFAAVNEFRAALADSSRLLLPRIEYENAHRSLVEKMDALTMQVNEYSARSKGVGVGWGIVVAAMGMMVSIVTLVVMFTRLGDTVGR